MSGKPNITRPFGDNPVLDILHIAYVDLVLGRLTSVEKLKNIMYATYSAYNKTYITNLIKTITDSQWFKKTTNPKSNVNFIHLQERGVEVYLNMIQLRNAEMRAEEANTKANWILAFTIITVVIMIIEMITKK